MARTIRVSTWGRNGLGMITVRVRDDETAREGVARSISRRTGFDVVSCQDQGYALEGGQKSSHHYQMTLGLPVRSRGHSVEGEIWVAIPVAQ